MKLVIKKELKNNNAEIEFTLCDITNTDIEALKDFGKPLLQTGGTIPLSDGGSFKVSNESRVLPDDFPFTKEFKSTFYGVDTIPHAEAYIEEMKKRITEAVTTLESMEDTFTGEEIVQL